MGRSACARHLIGQASVAHIMVWPEQPHGLAVFDLLEDHLVAAHRPSPHPVERPPRSPASRKNWQPDVPSTRTIS